MSRFLLFISLFLIQSFSSFGQAESDSTESKWWKDFSIEGYFQFQYHYTNHVDSVRLHSFSAGNFERFNNNKFMVRRSRLRVNYNKKFASSALSLDITERGVIMKDAWLSLKDPWLKAGRLDMGMFALPFGHETQLRSMSRETPERSRVIQTLFPSIRDIGANFNFQLPEDNPLHFLRLDAGVYHGTHANMESDNAKDFVGRLMIDKPMKTDWFNFSLAYSHYEGKVKHQYDIDGGTSNYHYVFRTMDTTFVFEDGKEEETYTIMLQDYFPMDLDSVLNDTSNRITPATYSTFLTRRYHSVSGQIDLNLKTKNFSLGKTTLRGEYVWGDQVSQEGTLGDPYVFDSESPTGPFVSVTWPKFDSPQPYNPASVGKNIKPTHSFVRRFQGLYFYLDQQIGRTGHHLVYKFDYYDPNTDVEGEDIRLNIVDTEGTPVGSSGLSVADVAFVTHGFGYRYVANEHLSFMLYYENPRNEITNLEPLASTQINLGKYPHTGFLEDIKDDVFTVRVQYIF